MKKTMNYDKQNDMFAVHNGFFQDEEFETNIEIGDLILDVSTKNRIVGIEILDASEYLKGFLKTNNIKELLENMKDATLIVETKKKNTEIILLIISELPEKKKEIRSKIVIPVPKSAFC